MVRLRWLGPFAGMTGKVSRFSSGGPCGCCPWFRLASGLPALVGYLFDFTGFWLSLKLSPASPVSWVYLLGVGRAPPMACSGSFLLLSGWGQPPLFFGVGWSVCLVLPLPSLCRCIHCSVNGVTNWTADRAIACRCVVCGHRPCPGSARRVVHVHACAGRPSCWVGVRFRTFWLGGCARRFSGARGLKGGMAGGQGAFLGMALLDVPPLLCRLFAFGGFNFPLAPGGLCGRGVAGVRGVGCVRFFRPRDRRPRWGGGGWVRQECGGPRVLACVVWF